MMRRSLALAVAMASGALAVSPPVYILRGRSSESDPRAHTTGTSGGVPHSKRRGKGWSMAQAKRMKRKRRNRLRAKGQHRKAVR